MAGDFSILLVCTGNICRSATAEQLLRSKVRKANVRISSAGTHALEGEDMPPQAQQVQSELGVESTKHVSRQLTTEMLESADLVLAATSSHRSDVARTLVKANRYTFTILEFAEIIEFLNNPGESDFDIELTGTSLHERLLQAAAARGYLRSEQDRDIPDPFAQELDVYRRVGETIAKATSTIAEWINK